MTARAWAATVEPGGSVRWRALEVAAFERYPKVLRRLDPKGKYTTRSQRGGSVIATIGWAVLALVSVVAFLFPSAVGFVILLGDRFGRFIPDPNVSIPLAGSVFILAVVALVISLVLWMRRGRHADGMAETQAAAGALFGVLSLILAWTRGQEAEVAGWPAWTGVIAFSALVAIVYLAMLIGARRADAAADLTSSLRGEESPRDGHVKAVEPLKQVRLAVERLPAGDRDAIRADIDAAIDDLVGRGIIDEDDAAWARKADLGKLALHMSQPRSR